MDTMQTYLVNDAKAILLVVHGSGEHIGRYRHVAVWLNKHHISMVGGDLPGLGRSKEKRGHIQDFANYLHKIDQWFQYIKKNWPEKPTFLLGHSMGGLIVLRYLEELKDSQALKGVIVTSPAVSIGIEVPKWQRILAENLVKVWPTMRLKSGITASQVSRDPKVVKAYAEDPLVYNKVSIAWFLAFQKAIELVWKKKDQISRSGIPLLYLQAGEDQLVDPQKAKEFVEGFSKEQVQFHLIDGLYHEILNEPEKEIYLQLITDWMSKKIE
ncbi:lysophospholipase [Tepidibacillus infernus]|uniref:alpha/beta hydrolase n=1 Tax=Tepidibacillus infernus TaxID=1806172 RepID=UPI003B737BDB